jgi:nicotinamidase-related amidase
MERVLPIIVAIADRYSARTVFIRFIPPASPADAPGQWRPYFERWGIATRQSLGSSQLGLVPELARYAPPATTIEQPAYSAFFRSSLADFLFARHIRTVAIPGTETDVCVLSTVVDAVNIGFRVVIAEDALCSSSDAGHDANVSLAFQRTNQSGQHEAVG